MTMEAKTETTAQMIARVIHSQGGRILVVGGETNNLPEIYKRNPQIEIWDDNDQKFTNKEVPRNTRIILCSRWLSHGSKWKLDKAAKELRAIKFANLKQRQIKECLSEIIKEREEVIREEVSSKLANVSYVVTNTTENKEEQIKEEENITMVNKKPSRGELKDFIDKNINTSIDYTVLGSKTEEGRRLFKLAKEAGIDTTLGSVTQAVTVLVNKPSRASRVVKPIKQNKTEKKVSDSSTHFTEIESLIDDSIAAMQLVKSSISELRKNAEDMSNLKKKLAEFLGV